MPGDASHFKGSHGDMGNTAGESQSTRLPEMRGEGGTAKPDLAGKPDIFTPHPDVRDKMIERVLEGGPVPYLSPETSGGGSLQLVRSGDNLMLRIGHYQGREAGPPAAKEVMIEASNDVRAVQVQVAGAIQGHMVSLPGQQSSHESAGARGDTPPANPESFREQASKNLDRLAWPPPELANASRQFNEVYLPKINEVNEAHLDAQREVSAARLALQEADEHISGLHEEFKRVRDTEGLERARETVSPRIPEATEAYTSAHGRLAERETHLEECSTARNLILLEVAAFRKASGLEK